MGIWIVLGLLDEFKDCARTSNGYWDCTRTS